MRFGGNRDAVELYGRYGAQYDGEKARYLSLFWLYVEPDDTAFTVHWRDGFWESWITAWMDNQFDDHDVFVDVGANVGYYTFLAAANGLPVFCVEPQSHLMQLLMKSKDINDPEWKLVNLIQYAISNEYGEAQIAYPAGHSGAGSIVQSDFVQANYEVVPTIPFDYIYEDHMDYKRWLVKIDAEGAEPLIWEGMERFRREANWTILLEWAPSRYEDPRQFASDLLEYGVSMVDTTGGEIPMTMDSLMAVQDFEMVVVRN
jgi:FkbM family methyltransferase